MMSLPEDVSEALQSCKGVVRLTDPNTGKVYALVNEDLHRKSMSALRELEDLQSIRTGLEQAERGEMMTLQDVDAAIRKEFRFPRSP